jgi:hypothetical protein
LMKHDIEPQSDSGLEPQRFGLMALVNSGWSEPSEFGVSVRVYAARGPV